MHAPSPDGASPWGLARCCSGRAGPPGSICACCFPGRPGRRLFDLLQRLFPPDLSLSFLKVALHATLTTAATAVIATAISSILALPLGILASGRLWRTGITAAGANGRAGSLDDAGKLDRSSRHGRGALRARPGLGAAVCCRAGAGSYGRNAGTGRLLHRTVGTRLRGCIRRDRCAAARGPAGAGSNAPADTSLRHSSPEPGAAHLLHSLLV